MLGVVSAANRGQDVPADADRTAAANTNSAAAFDPASETSHQAYLGLEVTKLTKGIRRALELPDEVDGLVVVKGHRGSPAAEAGLKRGDVAMSFDGHTLVEPQQLRRFLNSKNPGDVIEVVYYRDGARHSVSIELGRKPNDTGPRPEWLKQVHTFLRTFPNAVDGSLRLLDDDGEVRTFVLMPGEVVGIGETEIAVQDKLGEVHFFPFTDRTVFYARHHQIRPSTIEAGMKVAVLTVNGNLKAVVVTHRADSDEPIDEDRIAKARERLAEIELKFDQRIAELDEKTDGRIAELRAKAAERKAELRAKAAERKAELEAKLRERLANANDVDDDSDDDDEDDDDSDEGETV
jgi:hypothetical protein